MTIWTCPHSLYPWLSLISYDQINIVPLHDLVFIVIRGHLCRDDCAFPLRRAPTCLYHRAIRYNLSPTLVLFRSFVSNFVDRIFLLFFFFIVR
jgi:hypothetical protein